MKSAELTLTFTVIEQDDDGWPWAVTLADVTPRGTGLGWSWPFRIDVGSTSDASCNGCGSVESRRLCDACAVEEWIRNIGSEAWLKEAGVDLDREGTLRVKGYVDWPTVVDDHEEFQATNVEWLVS